MMPEKGSIRLGEAAGRPFAVAFSGGLDSSLVCAMATRLAPGGFIALTARTPFVPREDIRRSEEIAALLGFRHIEVDVDPVSDPAIAANPPERCYLCKRMIFEALASAAAKEGIGLILDGTNADDMESGRPGLRALKELGIRSPLADMGLRRADVARLAVTFGLPDPDRPNSACLATRISSGTPITRALLDLVDRAEEAIHALGFVQVRFRTDGITARVELGAGEAERATAEEGLGRIALICGSLGIELTETADYRPT